MPVLRHLHPVNEPQFNNTDGTLFAARVIAHHPELQQRRSLPAPQLTPLPQIANLPTEIGHTFRFPHGYIDPDMLN